MDIGRKIAVVGSPGSGKSTFARSLAAATGLPLHHLDSFYWAPGWQRRHSPEEWRELQARLVAEEAWIIDGNYHSTLDIRIKAADTVILLDAPVWRCLAQIHSRIRRYRAGDRPDMGADCPEKLGWDLAWRVVAYPWRGRPRVLALAARYGKDPVVLSDRAEADAFVASLARQTAS